MKAHENNERPEFISANDIIFLLQNCVKHQYNPKQIDSVDETIQRKVRTLFEQDYICQLITNSDGELCSSYPRQILVPIVDKWCPAQTTNLQASTDIYDRFVRARFARCRSRHIIPTLLINGRYICRSSTLSSWGEIYSRMSKDLLVDAVNQRVTQPMNDNDVEQPQQQSIYDKLRGADIDLLNTFNIGIIINLMVQTKNALLGMKLTASERSDKYDRYRTFQLLSLPYPGCEHFSELAKQKYNADFMIYDWSTSKDDALLEVPPHVYALINVDWSNWRAWTTVHLTQNYLRIIIRLLETSKRGILIHCLSGWDRTPLMISLLRLSLWADGHIHQSLTVEEILYLTIAYDWYLFGHNLPERLASNEEILYFTFSILRYLVDDEFSFQSINNVRDLIDLNVSNDATAQHDQHRASTRKEKLLAVWDLLRTCYGSVIPENPFALNNSQSRTKMTNLIKNFVLQKRS